MTDEQKKQFREEGYLLASGLIPEDVARKGEDAMWAALGMDRDDPETWDRVSAHAISQRQSRIAGKSKIGRTGYLSVLYG